MIYSVDIHFDCEVPGTYSQSLIVEIEENKDYLEIQLLVDKGNLNYLNDVNTNNFYQ